MGPGARGGGRRGPSSAAPAAKAPGSPPRARARRRPFSAPGEGGPPPPPTLPGFPQRQASPRPGLLPQVYRSPPAARGTAQPLRAASALLPPPPAPRRARRRGAAPRRSASFPCPPPAAGGSRGPEVRPRRGSRPLPPNGTNGSPGSRHKGESLQLPVWAPGPPRRATPPRRPGHAPCPPSVAGPGGAPPPARRAPTIEVGLQVGREGPSRAEGGAAARPAMLWEVAAAAPVSAGAGKAKGTVTSRRAGGEGWLCEVGPGLAPPGAGEGCDGPSREGRGRPAATPGQPAGKPSESLSAGKRELKTHKTAFHKKPFAGPEVASALNSVAFLSKTPKLLPCPLRPAPALPVPAELHHKHCRGDLLLSPLVPPARVASATSLALPSKTSIGLLKRF